VFIEIPLKYRLLIGLVALGAMAFAGFRTIGSVKQAVGPGAGYIADRQTGCVYPERYVTLKNAKEPTFLPVDRQVNYATLSEAQQAGYRQCTN